MMMAEKGLSNRRNSRCAAELHSKPPMQEMNSVMTTNPFGTVKTMTMTMVVMMTMVEMMMVAMRIR